MHVQICPFSEKTTIFMQNTAVFFLYFTFYSQKCHKYKDFSFLHIQYIMHFF